MPYITTKQSPAYKQISLEDILKGGVNIEDYRINNDSATKTIFKEHVELSDNQLTMLVSSLIEFNRATAELHKIPRADLYTTFRIPKRSGGLRRIDAPKPELMEALRSLKSIFETKFFASYHTSAFAYVKGRSAVDSVRKHQANDSHWFLKTDFSDFFGSTTPEFVQSMLAQIYPFSAVMENEYGKSQLLKALDLCFLNGGLPQGTPISPMLTNLIMIPIDHKLTNTLLKLNGERFIYSRYADDILISCHVGFSQKNIEKHIRAILEEFNAPYLIKPEKTRYASRSGRNWNLGVMLNKDNEITIGHAKKKTFRAMLFSFITDTTNGKLWSKDDVQYLQGIMSYYRMIEPESINAIVDKYNQTYGTDIDRLIKDSLK